LLTNERGGMSGQSTGALAGMVVGAVVGLILAIPTGGLSVPAGLSLGASIGGTVGGLAGALYDTSTAPDQIFEQDQLSRIFIQDSGYGGAIPQVFQRYRLAGNVIWIGDKLRHEHREVVEPPGGKGGGPQTINLTYTYTVDLAVMLCDTRLTGPMRGISKIWADGTVIYDNKVTTPLPPEWTFYPGTASQGQDETIMAEIGPENTPAYRYRCYVVGHQVDLGVTGRVPNYTFEVYQGDAGATATPLIALARDPGTGDLRTLDQATRLRGRNPATLAPTAPNVLLDPDKPLLWRGGVALGISPAHITWAATSDAYALWRVTEAGDVTSFPVGFSLIGNLVFVGETVFTGGFHYDNEVSYLVRADTGGPTTIPLSQDNDYFRLAAWPSGVAILGYLGQLNLFTPAGTPLATAQLPEVVYDLCWHPTRNELWIPIPHDSEVRTYNLAGTLLERYPSADNARYVTVDTEGQVWVAGLTETVRHDAASGAMLVRESVYTSIVQNPGYTVLVPADAGRVWVVDWAQNRLTRIDTSGGQRLVRLPAHPMHLEADPTDGGVFALCNPAQQVLKVHPDLKIQGVPSSANLPQVLTTLCRAAGIPANAIDTSQVPDTPIILGLLNIEAARIPVEMLCRAYQLLPIESNGVLRFLPRSQAVQAATIPATDLLATEDSGPNGALVLRLPELQMPTAIQVLYIDPQQSYQQNTQRASIVPGRDDTARANERTLNVLIGLTPQQAKRIAQETMDRMHLERTSLRFATTRRYARIEPGDLVDVEIRGLTYPVLLTEVAYGRPGLLRCTGTVNSTAVLDEWVPQPSDPPSHDQPPSYVATVTPVFLHLPALGPQDVASRYHVVYQATRGTWRGASLWRASEHVDYQRLDVSTIQGITGTASLLPAANPALLDDTSVVTVRLTHGQLRSVTDSNLFNGANLCVIGPELLHFGRAELVSTGTYQLRRLLRGRRGTEWAVATHADGDVFVLLDAGVRLLPLPLSDRGVEADYKAVSAGQGLTDAEAIPHTPQAANLLPWQVAYPGAVLMGTDWELGWWHRARFNSLWTSDNDEIVADSDVTSYQVRIWDDATVVRSQTVALAADVSTRLTWVYTEAMQVADFGTAQTTVTWSVRQRGNYGWGRDTRLVNG
jgi:hypothetical protein